MRKDKIIRITIDLPMSFPKDWDNEMIEFHLNESHYCKDNIINDLYKYSENHGCICNITECKVID